jgi:glyoxylase-like metal-dependent hydrolase (beta-lactamase superfamily II)
MTIAVIPLAIWKFGMINCFVVRGDKTCILVDTGLPGSERTIIKQLRDHNIRQEDVRLIVVTHGHVDHFGSAAKLRQLLNVPILAHEADLAFYTSGKADMDSAKANKPQWKPFLKLIGKQTAEAFSPDIILQGDVHYDLSSWGAKGHIIHTPGHTPGSISIILDNGESIIMDMMASGILLGGVMFYNRVKHPPFHDDKVTLRKSFEKLLLEKGERYYLGHGGPVTRQQVERYITKYL